MAVPRVPGGGTVAQLPGDRDSARLPRMVETALGRPGHTGHLASRTHFRIADSQWAVNHSRTRTVSLGIWLGRAGISPEQAIRDSAADLGRPLATGINGPPMARRSWHRGRCRSPYGQQTRRSGTARQGTVLPMPWLGANPQDQTACDFPAEVAGRLWCPAWGVSSSIGQGRMGELVSGAGSKRIALTLGRCPSRPVGLATRTAHGSGGRLRNLANLSRRPGRTRSVSACGCWIIPPTFRIMAAHDLRVSLLSSIGSWQGA
jgi:hypothetical protein